MKFVVENFVKKHQRPYLGGVFYALLIALALSCGSKGGDAGGGSGGGGGGATTADTTAPTFASAIPASGATGVSLSPSVSVTFNEPMDVTSVNGAFTVRLTNCSGTVVSVGTPTASVGNTVFTYAMTGLTGSQLYATCVGTGATDVAANALGTAVTLTWTTTAPGTLSTPVANPVAGTYSGTQNPTLTSDAGSTICYRIDGPNPAATTPGTCDAANTTIASGASVNVSATTTIKALATKIGSANSAVATVAYVIDTTAPGNVTTLATGTVTSTSVQLNWTAVGNDGGVGTAASYEIRYASGGACPFTDGNFNSTGTVWGSPPTPQASGSAETVTLTGFGFATLTQYWFAIKVKDAVNNVSTISNCATGSTPPDHVVISEVSTTDNTGTGGCSGAACEYIELFNPTSNNINIDGWKIQAKSSNTSLAAFVTITAGTCANATYTAYASACVIPARGFLLLKSGQPASITGTRTSGSPIITAMASTATLLAGDIIGSGSTGIPTGSTILSVDSATQITLSANATSGAPTAGPLFFGANRFYIPANGANADFLMAGNSSPGLSNTNNGIQLQTAAKAGTRTNGSAIITGVTDTSGLFVGASISGTGIPAGATILSFVTNTSVTMSANATANSSATWIPVIDSLCFGTHTLSSGCEGASATITLTGDTTNTSATITNMASTVGLANGYFVTATPSNVPALSTIVSFVPNTSVTLSANATVTAAGVSFNFNAGTGTAVNPAPTGAIERKAKASSVAADMMLAGSDYLVGNSQDTDNNSADFVAITTKNPQNRYSGGTE